MSAAFLNLSGVGNLKKMTLFGPERKLRSVSVKCLYDRSGRLYYTPKVNEKCQNNLRKGGREKLARESLTSFASRRIRNAGRMLRFMVDNEIDNARSSVMITLTYGKQAPDHKTAKKHLNTFLTQCRNLGELKYYVWVAQLQTGKRAKELGRESYRAEHGSAIHFHILTLTHKGHGLQLRNAQGTLRHIWKQIVNKWEHKAGHEQQNIGGVDVRAVYNAGNYIARYLKNEQDTILGNMWNMSSHMRKAIQEKVTVMILDEKAFEATAGRFNAKRLRKNSQKASHDTISVDNWDESPIIITNDVKAVLFEINRYKRNMVKLERMKKLVPI